MHIKNKILSQSNQFKHYKEKSEKLSKENKSLKDKIEKLSSNEKYEKGISIIIPTYKGESYIQGLLDSLANQTLSKDLFELIFVINGELDSTTEILKDFILKNPEMNIIFTYTTTPGVSNARNIGIGISQREYIGFVDDDDYISEHYLESLYNHSAPNRVVMTNFIDVDEDTGEKSESYAIPFSEKRSGIIDNAPISFRGLSSVTVAKIIPTYAIKTTKFNTELKSGVDISYHARLYPKFDFEFFFIPKEEDAVYYRIKRTGSISRQELSYEFNILGRLGVIEDINRSIKENKPNKKYLRYLKRQANIQVNRFMKEYLQEHPEDREKIMKDIEKRDLVYFPYDKIE
jgi:glycosyltransferase involved in cell wall biosynthesis